MLNDAERSMLLEELARRPHALSEHFTHEAHLVSPTCGDEVTVRLTLAPTLEIQEISWDGHGCTVSKAAAAALSELTPIRLPEFPELFAAFEASVNGGAPFNGDSFDELAAFAGIGRFPLRARCATLAWRAALQAIDASNIDVQAVPEV